MNKAVMSCSEQVYCSYGEGPFGSLRPVSGKSDEVQDVFSPMLGCMQVVVLDLIVLWPIRPWRCGSWMSFNRGKLPCAARYDAQC